MPGNAAGVVCAVGGGVPIENTPYIGLDAAVP
jgi:hypothetical protein